MQQVPAHFDFSSISDQEIQNLLVTYQINLTVEEAKKIQGDLLKRPPTFAECILWAIQGSEHCSYKSSRKHLQQFVTKGPHVILGPKEDAGIVAVATDNQGIRYGVVMSHESHNHPSQIVPYEGAATGVGGNVRDVCCMGAEVIAIADGLRFGDLNVSKTHWIHEGVVKGIGGYGNPLGIPTLAGDVYYDPGYNDNCLVTVVTLGVIREDHIIHSYAPEKAQDYVYILVGKPTDNSGFGGASFASSALQEDSQEKNKGAVQEPNAFLERHLLKANYALFKQLREQNLIDQVGFKDLGAGGIACASVELADAVGLGAEIDLDKVPVSMKNLLPAVILCSETQERFMWIVPPSLVDMILHHYNDTFALPNVSAGACAAVIGQIRTDGNFVVKAKNQEIVNAKACDVTKGILYDRPFVEPTVKEHEPSLQEPDDFNQVLLRMLAHENIACRAPIYETYDKQVQGRTLIEAGFADAGVMQPFNEEKYPEEIRQTGIALSLDQNPRYNKIDPYWGAVNAIAESVRNVSAVGATPVAITDCLCFGNPEKPEQMGEMVASMRGIADACKSIKLSEFPEDCLPIISGNVSLYNESETGVIPASPMISCLGVLKNADNALTYDLKYPQSLLFLIGERKDECGGSVYYQLHGELGSKLPKPDLQELNQQIQALHALINANLVLSAHDISDGGIACALAEMTFKREIGISVDIPAALPASKTLFSETGGFVIEVAKEQVKKFEKLLAHFEIQAILIGNTTKEAQIKINNVIDVSVAEAKIAWEHGLRERLL